MSFNKNIVQQGRSMIEMLGVLAIIGVLSVGGLVGYSKAMERYRVNETINQITYIVENVHSLFKSQRDYSDILEEANIVDFSSSSAKIRVIGDKAQLFRASVVTNGYKNVFGGSIRWYSGCGRFSRRDKKSFSILYYGVPQAACIELVTKDWRAVSGFLGMEVEGSKNMYDVGTTFQGCYEAAVQEGTGLFCAKAFPIKVEDAVKVCDTERNSVQWHFY